MIICNTAEEAKAALESIMVKRTFGDAGNRVVIEEYMEGPEVSVLSFCDGKNDTTDGERAGSQARVLITIKGLTPGGWGHFRPAPNIRTWFVPRWRRRSSDVPCTHCRRKASSSRVSCNFGLMLTKKRSEAAGNTTRVSVTRRRQVVLPRMKNDLLTIMDAVIDGKLDEIKLEWDERSAVCVVMASGGYPGSYPKGKPITGLDKVKDAIVFHAGTAKQGRGLCEPPAEARAGRDGIGKKISQMHEKKHMKRCKRFSLMVHSTARTLESNKVFGRGVERLSFFVTANEV